MENISIFYDIWSILLLLGIFYIWPFGIFWCHLVYFPRFGTLYHEKSGNPERDPFFQFISFEGSPPSISVNHPPYSQPWERGTVQSQGQALRSPRLINLGWCCCLRFEHLLGSYFTLSLIQIYEGLVATDPETVFFGQSSAIKCTLQPPPSPKAELIL
jgi:hypothetical protein